MLLFLGLDGVLRRQHAALYRLEADCLAAFEDALRWIPEAEVVITSTWREVMPLPELRALFSEAWIASDDDRDHYPPAARFS